MDGHWKHSVSSVAQSCLTLCDPIECSMPGFPVHHQLQEFDQTHVHRVDDAIQPSHALLSLLLLPSIFPCIRLFSNKSALHIRRPKYWSFSLSINPSMNIQDWFPSGMTDLISLQVQRTLKNLLQHHSSEAAIFQCSAFFMNHLEHPCMTTGKTIALTRWSFVGKVMSLLLNMVSILVIAFLPRSKHLLISWLQSPSAGILEPQKVACHCFLSLFPLPFAMKWWDQMPWSSFSECWVLSQLFHSPVWLSSRGSLVPLHCHKGGVICRSSSWWDKESMGLTIWATQVQIRFCCSSAVWLVAGDLASLSLSLSLCKMTREN